jgi:hypothetical protein
VVALVDLAPGLELGNRGVLSVVRHLLRTIAGLLPALTRVSDTRAFH